MKEEQTEIKEDPREHIQGWWFPIAVVRLAEKQIISWAEFILLGRITSLCREGKGAWVSNKALGTWINRSSSWVSQSLSRMEELGLLQIKIKRVENKGTYRTIWVAGGVSDDGEGGIRRRIPGVSDDESSLLYKNNKLFPAPVAPGMDIREGRVFQLCKDFRQLVKERTGKHYPDHIIQKRWTLILTSFIRDQLQGDQSRFVKVLDWYKDNIDGEFIPECSNLPMFCLKFRQIEKARSRHFKSNGESSDAPEVEAVFHKHNSKIKDTW